jgi:glycosyltransferase involved in cell wall biosynthesis
MNDPIRVLYVSPGVGANGGAEQSLLGLLDGLDRSAVEPSAVVLGEGSMVDALRARGVDTTSLSLEFRGGASYGTLPGRLVASGVALRSLVQVASVVREAIDRNGAQVVHTNGMRGHVLLPALRRRGVAKVASIRELPRSRFEALLLRGALRSADAVIATSDYGRRQLQFARNVHVIDNPVAAPRLPDRLEARKELSLPPDAFVVAMLAHFHWLKGHLDLLRAVEALDDVWVILAGGDLYGSSSTTYRNEVLAFAQSHGFAHRVRCVGAVDDVGPVYASADVVAHCSIRPETFGRTLVEATLAEKPLVASSAGAPGEFVRHSQTGLLFAPGDTEALRGHLVSLRGDPQLRESLARAALVDVADRFDPRRHAARVLAVYQSETCSRGIANAPLRGARER